MQNLLPDRAVSFHCGAWNSLLSKSEESSQLLDLRLAPLNQHEVLSLDNLPEYHKAEWMKLEGSSEDTKMNSLTSISKERLLMPDSDYKYKFGSSEKSYPLDSSLVKFPHSPAYDAATPTSFANKSKGILYVSSSEDIEDSEDADGAFKRKLRLDKDQFALLEEIFLKHQRLTPKHKAALAKQLNVRTRQIEVWFQNRRARTKVKQTEMEREKLKAHCEALSDENRRLQALVQELKASQSSSSLSLRNDFWNQKGNVSVSICPACQRVSSGLGSASDHPPSFNHYDEIPNAIVIHQNSLDKQPLNLL